MTTYAADNDSIFAAPTNDTASVALSHQQINAIKTLLVGYRIELDKQIPAVNAFDLPPETDAERNAQAEIERIAALGSILDRATQKILSRR